MSVLGWINPVPMTTPNHVFWKSLHNPLAPFQSKPLPFHTVPCCLGPVGHWMLSCTSVSRSVPSIAAVSILGWFPQSDQYMVLEKEKG